MPDLTIRIAGTCCFVDAVGHLPNVAKRLVLPHDTLGSGIKRHIGYVEFVASQIIDGKDILFGPYKHGADNADLVEYYRFELRGHVIKIENMASGEFQVTSAYDAHVPKMTVVNGDLYSTPRDECFDPYPTPSLICGFFDIPSGTLDCGQLYEFITQFKSSDQPPTLEVQTPEYVDLIVPIDNQDINVTFDDGSGNPLPTVVLNAGTDLIGMGNQPEADIRRIGSGDDITRHFRLYYKLSSTPVGDDPPLPQKKEDPYNSCTVTNWP